MRDTEPRGRVVPNSPVEFLLAGPASRRQQGILIRSDNAGLDLVGAAAAASPERTSASASLLPQESRVLWVRSRSLDNINDPEDTRLSSYTLYWKGLARRTDLLRIEEELSRRAVDLKSSLKSLDEWDTEWHIAPIVRLCAEATAEARRRQWLNIVLIAATLLAWAISLSLLP